MRASVVALVAAVALAACGGGGGGAIDASTGPDGFSAADCRTLIAAFQTEVAGVSTQCMTAEECVVAEYSTDWTCHGTPILTGPALNAQAYMATQAPTLAIEWLARCNQTALCGVVGVSCTPDVLQSTARCDNRKCTREKHACSDDDAGPVGADAN